jgi:hypothetical protein
VSPVSNARHGNGRQLEVGEVLRGHVGSALTAAVSQSFSSRRESHIVFTREAFRVDAAPSPASHSDSRK